MTFISSSFTSTHFPKYRNVTGLEKNPSWSWYQHQAMGQEGGAVEVTLRAAGPTELFGKQSLRRLRSLTENHREQKWRPSGQHGD